MAEDFPTLLPTFSINLINLSATTSTTNASNTNTSISFQDEENLSREGGDQKDGKPFLEQLVSEEDYDNMMAVLQVVVMVVEAASLILTTTSVTVYAMKSMRCTTTVYLLAINLADTLCGALVTCSFVWRSAGGPQAVKSLAYNYLTVGGTNYLSLSCRRCVYCLSVIVSAERFFVISFPLKARHLNILQFPKLTVLILTLLVFSFHIYLPLKYQVVSLSTGDVGYRLGYTASYQRHERVYSLVSNSAKFLFAYIPLCLGLAMSLALLGALKRHAETRASLQEVTIDKEEEEEKKKKGVKLRSSERQLARTIWLSTFLFTLLSLPSNTVHLVSTYHATFGFLKQEHRLFRLLSRAAHLALVLSRYTNFLSYICLSTAFRQNLQGLFFRRTITTTSTLAFSKSAKPQMKTDHGTTNVSVVSSVY